MNTVLDDGPVIRRIWVDEFAVPIANVNWRFKWLWLYGFVHPKSGQTYWWILPYVNIELFNRVLEDFARHFGVGKTKQVVLVLDRAGWHTSDKVKVPDGIQKIVFTVPFTRTTTSRASRDADE
jgi:hypothetical protein